MNVRWFGAALIVTACTGFGFAQALSFQKEEKHLRQLLELLHYLSCELEYKLTPLPQLLSDSGKRIGGTMAELFCDISSEMDAQCNATASDCINSVLNQYRLSIPVLNILRNFSASLGQFDLSGQLQGLAHCKILCQQALETRKSGREERLRTYRLLGVSTGLALAIWLI